MGSLGMNLVTNTHLIYVPFCDNATTFIDCYTPHTNSWHRVTTIPAAGENLVLKDFAMVAVGPCIYVLGGRACRSGSTQDGEMTRPRVVAWVQKYNVEADRWEMCAPMSEARFSFACSVCDGKIYVAGGQTSLGRARGISSTQVYDPAFDRWISLANMRRMRYKCVGVTWKGRIHVVGGFVGGENSGPYDQTARSSAEVYDAERNEWIYVPRMWDLDVPPRQIVAVNGKLFSSGDCLQSWKGHIEAYDEQENIWNVVQGSRFNCMSPTSMTAADTGRCYVTMAPIGNQLYFLAGSRMPGEASSLMKSVVHAFDTAANGGGWRSMEPNEEEGEKELCGHCCVLNTNLLN